MNAIILSIGDELALGQTIDTNSAWISRELAAVGCEIAGHATVPDDQRVIERAIKTAANHCDFLIITGGIGPTEDDLTRQALAVVLDSPLEMNAQWLDQLHAFFQKVGRSMPESNKIQAMIPRGARMIENSAGTAAGMDVAFQSGDLKKVCRIFVTPGVPREMKAMFQRDILPHIAGSTAGAVILSRTLHTFGLGESSIAERLGDLMNRRRNPSVGTTVSNGMVSLRLNARFPSKDEARQQLAETETACRSALGDLIFGADDDTLPRVIADLLNPKCEIENPKSPQTVCTAESCTGGLLAKMLTDIPGSSAFFKQGWVTYSNQAKYERLGVSMEMINVYGAVSEPVVEAMAKNARRLAKSDFALAISGVAGPDGGSESKPVGTVCIALAIKDPANKANSLIESRRFTFPGDRETIRDRSAKMALTMLRYQILAKKMPF